MKRENEKITNGRQNERGSQNVVEIMPKINIENPKSNKTKSIYTCTKKEKRKIEIYLLHFQNIYIL